MALKRMHRPAPPETAPKLDGRTKAARAAKAAAAASNGSQHTDTEGASITINIPDHPVRTQTPLNKNAEKTAHAIVATLDPPLYGPEPVQMHHGGSLWVCDNGNWSLFLNRLGIEWSSQFCADPAKVELLRQNAERLCEGFPDTEPQLEKLGCNHVDLLHKPIKTAAAVSQWTDSIFNACVPLPAQWHVGAQPQGAGEHHYPRPITNIEFFKRDDFVLFHSVAGGEVAVVPTGRPGSGEKTTEMIYATPGTAEHSALMRAHKRGKPVILGPRHPISKAAFALQTGK